MKKLIILAASFVLVASFAMTAAAADWNFYGSARVSTFWTTEDTNVDGEDDVDDFAQGLQGNSRFGATVKVSDELTGGFEYGTGVNLRKLYGEWNFGSGSLLVGQTYTPMNWFYSNQVYGSDNDLLAQGGLYGGRQSMLQLKFGGFKIALVDVSEKTWVDAGAGAIAAASTEASMPAIEASYALSFDPVTIKLAGGYQTYEGTFGTLEEDVDSYVLAVGAKGNFGMVYVAGNVWMGQNPGNLIAVDTDASSDWAGGLAASDGVEVIDNDGYGYIFVVGAKINDMFSVEAGYGYIETEYDVDGVEDDAASSIYLQLPITLAPGVYVTPEIGMIDGDSDSFGVDESEVTYFGAKWQINF
jgi:hypothetical protein